MKTNNINKKLAKKLYLMAILFCFLAIITQNIYAFTITSNSKPTYGYTTASVNFRTYPNTYTTAIKMLARNTSMKIVGSIDSFYIVQLATNEVGLIHKSYINSKNTAPSGAKTYTALYKQTGTVTQDGVNFRRGASTSFVSISKLQKNTKVTVIGTIDDWYLVITNNGAVGMIYKQYLSLNSASTNANTTTTSSDVKLVLDLINEARIADGKPPLTLGVKSTKLAQMKAEDMVKNEYFSHTSLTYGNPFKMMSNYGLSYKAAGENIAGNPSIKNAVEAWLASPTHSKNLLSNTYNYVGIGIEKSPIYGYVIVAMFVAQ